MKTVEDQAHEGYLKFRGRCKELCDEACAADSSLTLVRGHYYCPIWNTNESHWWTVRQDGTVNDPTREQFPSGGMGIYTPFDGTLTCAECGKNMDEKDADIEGNYAFCSYLCHGRFVGVL